MLTGFSIERDDFSPFLKQISHFFGLGNSPGLFSGLINPGVDLELHRSYFVENHKQFFKLKGD